jgi:hypothetical protein
LRQKRNKLLGSPPLRGVKDARRSSATCLDWREDGKEEGEISEEVQKARDEDPVRRSHRRRQERLADQATSEAEESDKRRRRQRSVSKERRLDRWAQDKRSATPSSQFKEDSRPADSIRRELSPARLLRTSDRRVSREKSAPKSAIDSIKQANEQLALEIEQLQLLKAQKKLKLELQKLKEEVDEVNTVPAPLRLPRSSSLSIDSRSMVSDTATSRPYEPLSPASFLYDVSRTCLSGQTDGQFIMTPQEVDAPIFSPTYSDDHTNILPTYQPRDCFNTVSTSLNDVIISKSDLNSLRSLRERLVNSLQGQAPL